jgi:hypothetical protein
VSLFTSPLTAQAQSWRNGIEVEGPTLFVVLLIAALASLLIIWGVPKWQVRRIPRHDRFHLENEARKTVAQIVRGLAFLLGAFLTAETLRTTQQGQISDRFTNPSSSSAQSILTVRKRWRYASAESTR